METSGAEVTEEDKVSRLLQPHRWVHLLVFVKHFSPHSLHVVGSLLLRLTLVFLPVHAGAGGSEVNVHYEDLRTPGSTSAWPWLHAPHHKGTRGQPQRYLWDP